MADDYAPWLCQNSATRRCVVSWTFIERDMVVLCYSLLAAAVLSYLLTFLRRASDNDTPKYNVAPSFFTCYTFMERAMNREVQRELFFAEIACNVIFTLIYLLRLVARPKVRAVFSLTSIVDLLSIGSFIVLMVSTCQWPVTTDVKSALTPGTDCIAENTDITARTWFSFAFLRVLYMKDVFGIVEALSSPGTDEENADNGRVFGEIERGIASGGWLIERKPASALKHNMIFQVTKFLAKVVAVIFVMGCAVYTLELLGEFPYSQSASFLHLYVCGDGSVQAERTEDCAQETFSLFTALYFVVVTLGTVGYGDFAPQYFPSRLFVMFAILVGIVTFAQWASGLVEMAKISQKGKGRYEPDIFGRHVVVTGRPAVSQVKDFLQELYHVNHAPINRFITVFLLDPPTDEASFEGPQGSTKQFLVREIAHTPWADYVTYLEGSALNPYDLQRAAIERAEAVFVLPNRFSRDGEAEDQANLMKILAIRRYLSTAVIFRRMGLRIWRIARGLAQFTLSILRILVMALFRRLCLCCRCCSPRAIDDDATVADSGRAAAGQGDLVGEHASTAQRGFDEASVGTLQEAYSELGDNVPKAVRLARDQAHRRLTTAQDATVYLRDMAKYDSAIGQSVRRLDLLSPISPKRSNAVHVRAMEIDTERHQPSPGVPVNPGARRSRSCSCACSLPFSRQWLAEHFATIIGEDFTGLPPSEAVLLMLMLRSSHHKGLANSLGVPSQHILACDELQFGLLALSAMHKGISTFFSNLILSQSQSDTPAFPPQIVQGLSEQGNKLSPGLTADAAWMTEYMAGACRMVVSLHLSRRYHGLAFRELALSILKDSRGAVQLIGFDIVTNNNHKRPFIGPPVDAVYVPGAACYAIASDDVVLAKYSDLSDDTLYGPDDEVVLQDLKAAISRAERLSTKYDAHDDHDLIIPLRAPPMPDTYCGASFTGAPSTTPLRDVFNKLNLPPLEASQSSEDDHSPHLSSLPSPHGTAAASTSLRSPRSSHSLPARGSNQAVGQAMAPVQFRKNVHERRRRSVVSGAASKILPANPPSQTDNATEHQPALEKLMAGIVQDRLATVFRPTLPPSTLLHRGGHVVILCQSRVSYASLAALLETLRHSITPWLARKAGGKVKWDEGAADVVLLHSSEPTPSEWALLQPSTHVSSHSRPRYAVLAPEVIPSIIRNDMGGVLEFDDVPESALLSLNRRTTMAPHTTARVEAWTSSTVVQLNRILHATRNQSLNKYSRLYFVQGSPHNFHDISRCGVTSAKRVIILADSSGGDGFSMDVLPPGQSGIAHDSSALYTWILMQSKLGKNMPQTIVELASESSLSFLQSARTTLLLNQPSKVPLMPAYRLQDLLLDATGGRAVIIDHRDGQSPDDVAVRVGGTVVQTSAVASALLLSSIGPSSLYMPCPSVVSFSMMSNSIQRRLKEGFRLAHEGWPRGHLALAPPSKDGMPIAQSHLIQESKVPNQPKIQTGVFTRCVAEFAQGSAFCSSICESLLASSFYEPHVNEVFRAMVNSKTCQVRLLKVPFEEAVSSIASANEAAGQGVSLGYCRYVDAYDFCIAKLGVVPMGIMRHGARLQNYDMIRILDLLISAGEANRGYSQLHEVDSSAVRQPVNADSEGAQGTGAATQPGASPTLPLIDLALLQSLHSYYRCRFPPCLQDALAEFPGATSSDRTARAYLFGRYYDTASLRGVRQALLTRSQDDAGALPTLLPMNYVVTAPDADCKLKLDDLIIALTSTVSPQYIAAVQLQRWFRSTLRRV